MPGINWKWWLTSTGRFTFRLVLTKEDSYRRLRTQSLTVFTLTVSSVMVWGEWPSVQCLIANPSGVNDPVSSMWWPLIVGWMTHCPVCGVYSLWDDWPTVQCVVFTPCGVNAQVSSVWCQFLASVCYVAVRTIVLSRHRHYCATLWISWGLAGWKLRLRPLKFFLRPTPGQSDESYDFTWFSEPYDSTSLHSCPSVYGTWQSQTINHPIMNRARRWTGPDVV